MKLRTGLVIGFGAGYYFGAKAGRERYEQIRSVIDRIGPVGKLHAAVDLGLERFRPDADSDAMPPRPSDAVVPPSPN
jgi:hypothetical protein